MATEKKVIEIDINVDVALKDAAKLKDGINFLKQATENLKEKQGETSEAYIKATATLKSAQKEYNELTGLIEKSTTANKDQAGTLQKLETANALLRKEQKSLNLEKEEGLKRNKEINEQLNKNNEFISANSDKLKQNKMNIVNYAGGIKDALSSTGGALGKLGGAFEKSEDVVKKTGGGFGLWGLAITGIITVLSKIKPLMQGIGEIMEGVSAIINTLLGRAVKLFSALGTIISGNLKKGFNELGDSVSNLGNAMLDAYNKGINYAKMLKDLENFKIGLIKSNAELLAQEQKLTLAADDNTRSLKEREKASSDLLDVQKKRAQLATELAKKELDEQAYKVAREKENLQTVKSETLSAYQEKRAALITAQSNEELIILQSEKKVRDIKQAQLQRELDFIIDDFDTRKTVNEKMINDTRKTYEERFNLINENKKLSDAAYNDELKAIEKSTGVKIDSQKLVAAESTKELTNLIANSGVTDAVAGKLLQIMKERRLKQAENIEAEKTLLLEKAAFDVSLMQQELEQFKINNKSKLTNQQAWTETSVNDELLRLEAINTKQNETFEAQKILEPLKNAEINTLKLQTDADYEQAKIDLKQSFKDQENERKLIDLENELAANEGNIFREFELQQQKLDTQREAEIKAAERTGAAVSKINDKFNKADLKLEQAKINAKLSLAGGFASNIATIFGEQTKVGKAAAVASTTISAIQGAQASFTSLAPINPILAAVGAAAALAAGYANVKKILAVPTDMKTSGSPSLDSSSASSSGGNISTPTITRNISGGDLNSGFVQRSTIEPQQPIQLQPTLVVDDVTQKQNQSSLINKTTSIG